MIGRRTGLDRHGSHGEPQDDPLDGLVNLFDVGLVLAAAFLVAGLAAGQTIGRDQAAGPSSPAPASTPERVEVPSGGGQASGAGAAVGTVYRLPDGTLVLDREGTATR